ncbi:MAG: DUF4091 domain-containing protein [Ruminococcaceae bacterium]|nr:DUF4091 domain-containing protein [Oscillospiraceae bacterium]
MMSSFPIKTVVLSSLYKLFPEVSPEGSDITHISGMKNEAISFQVAYRLFSEEGSTLSFYAKIESDLPVALYEEGFVPVLHPTEPRLNDRYRPGLFADMLLPKKCNASVEKTRDAWSTKYFEQDSIQLHAMGDSWRALWLTINENGKPLPAGKHVITIRLYSRTDASLVGECALTVEIINAALPKQKLKYTDWFHCDCIADVYGVEIFSERFWEIFRNFASAAARHGMNMILTPCFTPPLDTPVGKERMTAQLVGVTVTDNSYSFDFSLLKRFLDESRACGIEYFEHSHLFTQWGAEHAPKIMATVNGRYKRIFGWETTACGKKYTAFLRAYIPSLLAFLKAEGLDKKFLFHISDEPTPQVQENYRKAKHVVADLLEGYDTGDALSHYDFYADGTVKLPIVATDQIHEFYGRCRNLWAYYTGGQCWDGMSNRKINCSPERNRMIGIQLYTHKIKGFLHWGYNYYYDMLSNGVFDPKIDPCFYNGSNCGTSYQVYPATDGTVIPSIRLKVFYEALNDMRALQLYERLCGRESAMALVEKYYGKVTFFTHAESADKLLAFREELNQAVSAAL